jgi:hypothetical protein
MKMIEWLLNLLVNVDDEKRSRSQDCCHMCPCCPPPLPTYPQVCWETAPCIQLLPCKHTVLCQKCSDALRKQQGQECPMCRTPVQKRVAVKA